MSPSALHQYGPCEFAQQQYVCDRSQCSTRENCQALKTEARELDKLKLGNSAVSGSAEIPTFHPKTVATEQVDILQEARRIIYGDREKTYGSPDKNLRATGQLWGDYVRAKYSTTINFDVDDVCLMMVLLKVARLANNPNHRDSLVDLCGYAALVERVQKHNATNGVKK